MAAVRIIGVNGNGGDQTIGRLTLNGGQFQLDPPNAVLLQRLLEVVVFIGRGIAYTAAKQPQKWFDNLYFALSSPYLRATKPGG